MSALFDATALVVPFENLRNDRRRGGWRQERQPRRNDLAAAPGAQVPTGFRDHGPRLSPASWPTTSLADKISKRLAALDTEDVRALAAAGAEIRAMVEAQPFPADLQKAVGEAFATLSAGNPSRLASRCVLPPPPKTCPTPRSRASRKPS